MMRMIIVMCFLLVACFIAQSEANYKKIPFNGSIFGKRNNVEYDSSGRAIIALCEIASETCQAWYQTLENK